MPDSSTLWTLAYGKSFAKASDTSLIFFGTSLSAAIAERSAKTDITKSKAERDLTEMRRMINYLPVYVEFAGHSRHRYGLTQITSTRLSFGSRWDSDL